MSEMLLVVELAGRRAALPTALVDCVIELDNLVPIPLAPVHVAGLAVLRSRPMTVIDCRTALGLATSEPVQRCQRTIVIEQGGHLYGLLVDIADDIVLATGEQHGFAADVGSGWRDVASGMIETETGLFPVLDPAALIDGQYTSGQG